MPNLGVTFVVNYFNGVWVIKHGHLVWSTRSPTVLARILRCNFPEPIAKPKTETIEQYLARGGKIEKIVPPPKIPTAKDLGLLDSNFNLGAKK